MDNRRQKAYYESRFQAGGQDESAANWITNRWTALRRGLQRAERRHGLRERVIAWHKQWLGDLSGRAVLDLGCFRGNELSLWLAEQAGDYTGIDLSPSAVAALNEKLEGLPHARAIAGDFLLADLPEAGFDVVYAHSVLHHFPDVDVLCRRLSQVLKPGGVVVSVDPTQTEPLNRLARLLYRPFQSDRDWEWPFSRKTFRILQRHFEIDRIQGYRGFSRIGLLIPPLMGWGLRMDERFARRLGPGLWFCWLVTMRMRKPA
ncbi:class I SAM-dependent methyltransferase [Natronospira bacteriovora]|uniref:Class I SAM-dependent methyltransferase n=1 Tax=Natronospira bacteriovora TaxID=3069753 RepID=A0ABU0W7Y0_9GAMM|nr:class I SAM-dependent methyltransferase [Natronospira sp. AB-CW4]MDQ2070111.1 class I SAM-dependent methyltransferase [Natronospira sp. AB-CW4]